MKVCECCGTEIFTRDGENRCQDCQDNPSPKRRKKARRSRKEMDDIMDSLGLVKVRGALGGVYYE